MKATLANAKKLALKDFGVKLTVEKITSTYVKNYVNDSSKKFQVKLEKDNNSKIFGAYSSRLSAAASGLMKLVKYKNFENLK